MTPLADFIETHPSLLVITGAGCSAPSGIPTYRNADAEWQRTAPIQHQDFLTSEHSRKRYWARSFAGWPAVQRARPNAAHVGLASLERHGRIGQLVTQNVDGLHQKAGHRNVIDLHGRLDTVICLDCAARFPRATLQERLRDMNPFLGPQPLSITPDGDAEVPEADIDRIQLPTCERCDGPLKPDVVFYGGSVEGALVERIYARLERAAAVLVVGSSLMVFSAFRFVRQAAAAGKPIAIVNRGVTRGDALATMKLDTDCEAAFRALNLEPEESIP